MKYKLIGFTGRKGHGKNTAAGALYGKEFAFASELKRTARLWFGLSVAQTDGALKEVVDERWGKSPREIMQALGTEVARTVHPDTWIRFLLDQGIPTQMAYAAPGELALITDVRFPNECAAIQAAGGRVVRIVRPGLPSGPRSTHPSEIHIGELPVDAEVSNTGSIEELYYRVLWATRDWR